MPTAAPRVRIWVDADALPGEIKDIILRAALRLQIPTVLVANKHLELRPNPLFSTVRVARGADVADAYIVEQSQPGDFCVTADIPLAAMLVEKGVVVLDPRGEHYSPANVGERLAIRDFMTDLRDAGVQTGGPSAYGPKTKQKFAALFDRLLTQSVRR